MRDTTLIAVRGDDNFYDVDASVDLDAGDEISFRAAPSTVELTDADATILKERGTGIADLETGTGRFQIQLEPADTEDLTDSSLLYHVVLRKVDTQMYTTVSKGTIRLTG